MCENTIIMATYNRAGVISSCLNSIQNQTAEDWECIIIDDGSTDSTKERVHEFVQKDGRFKYFGRRSTYRKGLPGCRNMGLDLAKGNNIVFIDDDDIVHPCLLELAQKVLKRTGKDFCNYQKSPFYGEIPVLKPHVTRGHAIRRLDVKDLDDFIIGTRAMASCTVLFKQECFENIRFNEQLHYAEEWECYSRILINGFEGVSIPDVLYFNRKHPASSTGKFQNGDPQQFDSMITASKLVIENVSKKKEISPRLKRFFLRLALQLNDYTILQELQKRTKGSILEKLKYKTVFRLYPVIKPFLGIKAKLGQI